jgi:hypothetical protein
MPASAPMPMPAIRREATDPHRRFCCPVPLTTPAPVHACRSCGRRQITDQEGRRRIPSARFCEFPAPHSPSPSILPLSRRQLYTDLTGLTATQLWQHPARRAARRHDMSSAERPGCQAAGAESRSRKGGAASRGSMRSDQRCLAPRCGHRAAQSRIVSPPCPRFQIVLGQNSARVSIVRGVAARRRGHAGPVAVADDRPHSCARAARTREARELSSGPGVFLASRQFMSGLLAASAPAKSIMSMHSRPVWPGIVLRLPAVPSTSIS